MRYTLLLFLLLIGTGALLGQSTPTNEELARRIQAYKNDPRGPYRDIRWFCKDGSFSDPKVPCTEPGGVQRARYKEEVLQLHKNAQLYWGQILATTPQGEFWDADHYHSRLKQYILEKFLRNADDGWILRKARYYRGAVQAEDEEKWGQDFLKWLLAKNEQLEQNYFVVREAVAQLPHRGDDDLTQRIRAVSKSLSEQVPAFMDLRIKIHGQPSPEDLPAVRQFAASRTLTPAQGKQFQQLEKDLEALYRPPGAAAFRAYLGRLPSSSPFKTKWSSYLEAHPEPADLTTGDLSGLLQTIREDLPRESSSSAKLALLDLSLDLEGMLFRTLSGQQPTQLGEAWQQIHDLGAALYGTGFIEAHEWKALEPQLAVPAGDAIAPAQLEALLENSRSLVEWGTGMVRAHYGFLLQRYGGFEPLAFGFLDDRVRSSLLLPTGLRIAALGDLVARASNRANRVFDLPGQGQIRGINPGYARGELVVVTSDPEEVEVDPGKIYLFDRPPSDLKPVAGIATVTEGNPVSHVQLLARNLGIPNAVLSRENLNQLRQYEGQVIFYAVSPTGNIVMKTQANMSAEEQALFTEKKRKEERVTVPSDRINLAQQLPVNLRELRATDSGILCGPKAANLGQLKHLFPDKVVEGFVIPFGIFRAHLEQTMPGQTQSYWSYLQETFARSRDMENEGREPAELEGFVLNRLATLRSAILEMELDKAFVNELRDCFRDAIGQEMGKVPVFLRSDTNMEDLKDFTGAGLNLTLFNVLDEKAILKGIREVWASPYSERSYKWRQKFLNNPENVFPSILVIPGVNVSHSGVMITKGIRTGNDQDLTVSFSRGVGGAVDGQASESWLLRANGNNQLLAPAREPSFRYLPATGGTATDYTYFGEPVLSSANLTQLREVAREIEAKMSHGDSSGPWDVELGFKDGQCWLFQIRPFVENKNANASNYLQSISVSTNSDQKVSLHETL